ncbi:UDP-glucose dehydrogenase family protein [Gracilimonas sp.]|uniref:UDP-glucose dehydrogenase family protein n=1 Tax=Gracilimonas sp. TaxID=1974203 RepID=UPI002871CADF|nr:UDP-glucose/GDP-mannose dehydrogenase family protein [Gracilimonas sp.]
MNIAIVGTGYVGLVSGTCFADTGNNVICVDIDKDKVERMRAGEVPIYEPGLKPLFDRNIRENRLSFTTDLKSAVEQSEIIFLCLPTPPGADGQADLSFVLQVAEELGEMITEYKVIVNKSTVPVGTADKVRETIASKTNIPFDVVSNPEFLREGAAVNDFRKPERVVVGTQSERAQKLMEKLYTPYLKSGNPLIVMDERSSELTKYAANSLLATKITFMNEIANICEKVGANVDNVRRGIGSDSRIGKRFLFAGIGYGGSCFPKDVQAIHHTAGLLGYDFKILDSVMKVNDAQKISLVPKVLQHFNGNIEDKMIGIWGLSFKPETDDVRESPSLYLMEKLVEHGAKLKAHDPEALETFQDAASDVVNENTEYVQTPREALEGIDALVIATEWQEFRIPDLDRFKKYMDPAVVFDGRNLFKLEDVEEAGIIYYSVGRPTLGLDEN